MHYGSRGGALVGYTYYIIGKPDETREAAYAPYVAQVTPNMTDRQKVELAIKAVVDRFDYVTSGRGSWTNNVREANCESYAMATQQLLAAIDIPSIYCVGNTQNGSHAWLQVFISGEGWKIVDSTMAETGHSNGGLMPFAEHAQICGYDTTDPHQNDSDVLLVARALIDAAYPEF